MTAEQVPSEDELDALMAWLRDLANADPAMADAVRVIAALRAALARAEARADGIEELMANDREEYRAMPKRIEELEAALARAESAPTSEEAEQVAARVEQWPYVDSGAAALIRQQAREIARLREELKDAKHHAVDQTIRGNDWRTQCKRAEQERDALRLAVDSLVAERETLAQERDALRADAERLHWLHSQASCVLDAEGYEWGVWRVKWEHGKPVSVCATFSDFSDLDAAIASLGK